jgi:RNA polymerase sigma-70 factor (ECF subfamily)
MEESALEPSDARLLERSASDPSAFGEFYQRHAQEMLAFFYRRTMCPQTAADLTAETFCHAFAARNRFRDEGVPARAWLYAIGRNQLSKLARRGRVATRYRKALGVDRVEPDDQSLERIELLVDTQDLRAAVRHAMSNLPERNAMALELRVGLDLPYAEVASRLGITEGAARVRVCRALSQLHESMEVS